MLSSLYEAEYRAGEKGMHVCTAPKFGTGCWETKGSSQFFKLQLESVRLSEGGPGITFRRKSEQQQEEGSQYPSVRTFQTTSGAALVNDYLKLSREQFDSVDMQKRARARLLKKKNKKIMSPPRSEDSHSKSIIFIRGQQLPFINYRQYLSYAKTVCILTNKNLLPIFK